jgi:hypothetical protein
MSTIVTRVRVVAMRGLLSIVSVSALSALAAAQAPGPGPIGGPGPDMTMDAATRTAVIDGAVKMLNDFYVFPETATKMTQALRDRQARHEYDAITSARQFAETLTTHLQEVSHDKHLRVGYSATPGPSGPPAGGPPPEEKVRMRAMMAASNFGFEKIERLAGNIGYLDLRGFVPPQFSGDTVAAAMTFLANTDAVIIDLRQNGGGTPEAVALISTYLFAGPPVHLNDIYDRGTNSTRQFWTLPYVPGKRLDGKDVYVLTSTRTFSAAEDFTYGLKNLKRATIVGEVTGGGAHPGGPHRITDHFFIGVPSGRSISPITQTDWEGVGVEPDIKVSAAQALGTAHLKALERRLPEVTDPRMKTELTATIDRLKKELGQMQ